MCWGASANVNTKNKDTLFENCVFNAKEALKRERAERRSGFVFCGDKGNTATIRNSRFYLADGEMLMQQREFKLIDCVEIVKSKDLAKSNPLTAKATASSSDDRHPVANATDGDAKTAWRSDSGTTSGEWLELDFGSPRRVDYLVLRENAFSSVSRFAIQTWDTKASRWRDCFNGGAIGPSFLVTPVPATTQRVRLYVYRTAYGSPGINEIEAYGE